MKAFLEWHKSITDQILEAIFNFTFLSIISIALFSAMFIGSTSVKALDDSSLTEFSSANALEIVMDQTNNTQIESDEDLDTTSTERDISPYPDLGDDQVFPFVAGLDSYE